MTKKTKRLIQNRMIEKWNNIYEIESITKFDFPKEYSIENKKHKGIIVKTKAGNLFIED